MAQVRRLGVLSVSKIMGIVYAIIGVIVGALFGLFAMLGGAAGAMGGDAAAGGAMAGMGFAAIIVFPLVYGAIGFVGGALMAFLYNVVAGMVGGVEIELS